MEIKKVENHKKQFLSLLLLADEQEDSPLTIPFYEKCGFTRSHSIKNFFTDNYNHPIYECGIQLVDMIYLQRKL